MTDFLYWKRENLYAEVWEQPLTKVAEKYGVSDVAMGKLCRRLRVPLPGRGYWARKEAGQNLKRTPLPAFKNPPVISYRRHEPSPKPEIDSSDPELAKIADVESRTVPIPTVEHRLVTTARRVLERARTDEYDRAHHPPSSPCVDIHVSKELLERALSIMNAILFALEADGLQVKVSDESTSVEVFDRTIGFGIEEDLRANGKREAKRRFSTFMVAAYERSGNLAFRVWTHADGARAHWGDSKTKSLEELLPKCIGGMFRHARLLRIEEEQRKQRELEWERQRLEEAERLRKAREEEERFRNLEQCMTNWQKAGQIRAFVDAFEKMRAGKGVPTADDSPKGQWITWARRKADWFDPLKK